MLKNMKKVDRELEEMKDNRYEASACGRNERRQSQRRTKEVMEGQF